jgi:hypothetical protein
MPRAKQPDADEPGAKGGSAQPRKAPRRKAVPSADTIITETKLTSPKGRVYRVIRTNQKDEYDEPADKTPGEAAVEGAATDDQRAPREGKRRRKT